MLISVPLTGAFAGRGGHVSGYTTKNGKVVSDYYRGSTGGGYSGGGSYSSTSSDDYSPPPSRPVYYQYYTPPPSTYTGPHIIDDSPPAAAPTRSTAPAAKAATLPTPTIKPAATKTYHYTPTSTPKIRVFRSDSRFYHDSSGTYYLTSPSERTRSSRTATTSSTHHPSIFSRWFGSHSSPGERDSRGRLKRSSSAKEQFMRMTGYPHGRPGYVIDHVVPLANGGADDPSNMQWQTIQEAKEKDKWERR